MQKQLAFGQTPFDGLGHAQLELLALKMYAALVEARSVMSIQASADPNSSYWHSRRGGGWNALMATLQVLGEIEEGFDCEEIYRAFFKFANSVFFEHKPANSPGWMFCDTCYGVVSSRSADGMHNMQECTGTLRPLTLDDIRNPRAG